MSSVPIISWQINGGEMDAATDFIFLGSKITGNSNHSHETER